MAQPTLGELLVRPSLHHDRQDITNIKLRAASLIDALDNELPNPKDPQQARLKELALQSFEIGVMLAVKALTA